MDGSTQADACWFEMETLRSYNLAYGAQDRGTIKTFSTLIFEVELLGIEK